MVIGKRVAAVFAAAVMFVGLSGCVTVSTKTAPEPTGGGDLSEAPPTSESAGADPEVSFENPKNLAAVTDACDLLTGRQLEQLGMKDEPEHKKATLGIAPCGWDGHAFGLSLTPDTKSGGMAKLYRTDGYGKGHERSEVSGYPAAWVERTDITCRVEVGVAESMKVGVSYVAYVTNAEADQVEPCEEGEKIAAMVLKNIPDA